MEIIKNPTQNEIKKAAKALKDGHLVAFPTETVYGLGADATNEKAVSRIYSVKGRPTDHPLIVHISSINQLEKWAIDIPEYAIKLAQEFWPGPMTLILKRSSLAKDFISGGQNSIGLRIPAQSTALKLIHEFEIIGGNGIAAPSANKFGAVSATSSHAVFKELGSFFKQKDLILDGGLCEIGIESTIINCMEHTPIVLRPGAVTQNQIRQIIRLPPTTLPIKSNLRFSGELRSHYAPQAKIIIAGGINRGDGFIALERNKTPKYCIRLASPKNEEEFARILYEAFRKADEMKLKRIYVKLPRGEGIEIAIRDRIMKAAAK
jgi:L-threonylcarbamoyladenylate synthase